MLNLKEQLHGYNHLVERAASLSEQFFQALVPAEPGIYYQHKSHFIREFIKKPDVALVDYDSFVYAGFPKYAEFVRKQVFPELETIQFITGNTIAKFFIFLADGKTMQEEYRTVGEAIPPYPFAVSSAMSCYYNSYWFKKLGLDHPAIRQACKHEVRHVAWKLSILDQHKNPTFSLIKNMVNYEALAGPFEGWDYLDDSNLLVDYSGLEEGQTDFYAWYRKISKTNNIDSPFFLNPVTKVFYSWAKKQGDEKYWITRS